MSSSPGYETTAKMNQFDTILMPELLAAAAAIGQKHRRRDEALNRSHAAPTAGEQARDHFREQYDLHPSLHADLGFPDREAWVDLQIKDLAAPDRPTRFSGLRDIG